MLPIPVHRDLQVGMAHDRLPDDFHAMLVGVGSLADAHGRVFMARWGGGVDVEDMFHDSHAVHGVLEGGYEARVVVHPAVGFGIQRDERHPAGDAVGGVFV